MISADEIKRVKGLGFLHDKNTEDKFNARVLTGNGKITAVQNRAISEAAEKFGSGEITLTTRLSMEIQGIPFENIEPLREYLAERGLFVGGTGAKIRPVVSCKGTTCQYGLIDTFALSQEIHEKFFLGYADVKLPHKFKIAVGGCPNNCMKPSLNDIGIVGQRVPKIDLEKCRGCKVCQIEKACPVSVPKVIDGKVTIDKELCNQCGRCFHKCPFKAFEESTDGYKVYIGGRWGKRVNIAKPLSELVYSHDELIKLVEKIILFYKDQGIQGERLSDTVTRIGFENVEAVLKGDGLLERKEEILAK